jgi:hypothetical protein
MAASRGSGPGPLADALETDESEDYVPIPSSKRVKIGVAETEGDKQQTKTAAGAGGEGPSSTASPAAPAMHLPVRYPPFPKPLPGKTEWQLRISKLHKKGCLLLNWKLESFLLHNLTFAVFFLSDWYL